MNVTKLEIQDVLVIEPVVYNDFRGYFYESYSRRTLEQAGITAQFVQDNHLMSLKKGTIRGIHFQNDPMSQAKLLRCTKGRIMDYAVDLRRGSPTYKKWVSVELSADNKKQIFIPKGFGHACISLEDDTEVQYKVDAFFSPENDRSIAWNDPELAVDWGTDTVIVSEKDASAPLLKDCDINFVYGKD